VKHGNCGVIAMLALKCSYHQLNLRLWHPNVYHHVQEIKILDSIMDNSNQSTPQHTSTRFILVLSFNLHTYMRICSIVWATRSGVRFPVGTGRPDKALGSIEPPVGRAQSWPLTSIQVRNERCYISLQLLYVFMECTGRTSSLPTHIWA
jgi:hypothetical protein